MKHQYSIDRDGDGISIYDGDCDDNDINITLAECTDDDNDGQNIFHDADDGHARTTSRDGDGYFVGPNVATEDIDCDDQNVFVYPTAPEFCNNTIDENCDGFDETDAAMCESVQAEFLTESTYTACSWSDIEASMSNEGIEHYNWSIQDEDDNPYIRFSEQSSNPQFSQNISEKKLELVGVTIQ